MTRDSSVLGVARTVGGAVGIAGRHLFRVDSNPVPSEWSHVTKVDPEPEKLLPVLYPLYLQHTDVLSVGGSRSVDQRTTEETFHLLEWTPKPTIHEPSGAQHVSSTTIESATFLAVPEVLNGDSNALVGTLGEGIEYIRESLAPETLDGVLPRWTPDAVSDRLADFLTSWLLHEAVFEAYIIQNPDSAAAREANVTASDCLTVEEARQRAMAAERHLESEILYLEYSGTFGGEEAAATLDAIRDATTWSRLWYGGGLDSRENARAMLAAGADAVVVGNVFHDIAAAERSICTRAADDLTADADEAAVREWVDRHVDVDAFPAVQYLETIPSVDDPAETARAYLVATVAVWMHVLDDGPTPSESLPERYRSVAGPTHADGDDDVRVDEYLDALTSALSRADGGPTGVPVTHLSIHDVVDG
ncbi:geranylgeranylglyceryl/heptaprenylglyceryl phosphate synthase [Halomarina oriensis]|uniref:phosphoglycerol geranylgeranyltransferase n=1 Tax=Halomarina oriensis TaxID=671145 RepID=A0A6B0GWL0_9EURY|nr:geranylgeranylglyceryl/heptaprenylglyceryl phosphate synthase [Halomarina oriensis]MWG36128.1 oxidoreductase [Halomarina oriensis]